MIKRLLFFIVLSAGIFTVRMPAQAAACSSSETVRSGISIQQIESGGMQRRYLRYIPRSYDATKAVPLVISLHGFASNALEQLGYTRWNALADQDNFIVVYPQGAGSPPQWDSGSIPIRGNSEIDDIQFMRELLDSLNKGLCIDPARIFVNGISNGGGMTYRMACEMSDQVAAIGTVAGAYYPIPGGCHPTRPMPVITFHGTADPLVNINGRPGLGLPKITAWVADWAQRNGCKTREDIPSKGEVSGLHYTDCKDGADVLFYEIEGGGHTWPGSPVPVPILGKTTKDINATETMWAFFQQHSLA